MTASFTFTAVVLYYRLGLEGLMETVRALKQSTVAPGQIVIVDNSPSDGVCDELLRDQPELRLVRSESNLGYAGGMNLGAQYRSASDDAVLFMTHELRLEPNAVELMAQQLRSNGAGVVGPTLLRTSTGEIWSRGGVLDRLGRAHHVTTTNDARTLSWLDGACLLVSERTFSLAKGFDEDYFLYWEDVDFGMRVSSTGETLEVCAGAFASQDTSLTPPYYDGRNSILLWRKHRRRLTLITALAWQLLRAVKQLVHGDRVSGIDRLRGIRSGLTFRSAT